MRRQPRRRMRAWLGTVVGLLLAAGGEPATDLHAQARSQPRSSSSARAENVVQAVRRSYERRPEEWKRRSASCLHYLDEAESFHDQGVEYFEQASRARSSPEQSRLVRLGNDAIRERQRLIDEFWACTRRTTAGDEFHSQDPPRRNRTPDDPGPPADPDDPDVTPPTSRPPRRPPDPPPGSPGVLPPGFPFPPAEAAPRRGRTPTRPQPMPVIVAFGDSITAGYGLSAPQAYPAVLQRRLQTAGLRYQVINAGVTGDTAQLGRARLAGALVPHTRILVVALGVNDMWKGRPIASIEADLGAIIETAQQRRIDVLLCGFEAPPIFDSRREAQFARVFPRVAQRYHVPLIGNLVEDVWNRPGLAQRDTFHPNAAGAQNIAGKVFDALEPLLRANPAGSASR